MRVLLMNDSNICLAISKELTWTSELTPKVYYTDNKGSKEIKFSGETYYEIFGPNGTLVKDGRGTTVSYADLAEGVYTLNYDNITGSFVRKK